MSVEVIGAVSSEFSKILTPEALLFVAGLQRKFNVLRTDLLIRRMERQVRIDAGELPDFLPETAAIRSGDWTITSIPADLQNRRVEITGPAGDRKMVIHAMNSGAQAFMTDFEDANSPTWENSVQGQVNLYDAIRRTIDFQSPEGKQYQLKEQHAVLIARPRGLHLEEKHVLIEGQPVSASLFDFGLYTYHNAKLLLENGSGPYFYIPKLESHWEARLWNDVFIHAEQELNIAHGSIKATVLIETILGAFEMDEILYELRDHIAALNCGRWDYIFSYIKKLRNQPDVILPDRSLVTMASPFMKAYSLLAIKTCHKRNALCIGGMAAQIPIKNNPALNEEAMNKVRADKLREVRNGHDGTWVAHPGLVPIAMEIFDQNMQTPNQVYKQLDEVHITSAELLEIPLGPITELGLRLNISVGVQYLEAWLRGSGAVPINNLMEDAATAEISRAQIWQWIRHPKGILEDGRKVTGELFERILEEELKAIQAGLSEKQYQASKFQLAGQLFAQMSLAEQFADFLTIQGYEYL